MNQPVPLPTYPFRLPALRFREDALEPYFDARSVRIHHGKYHREYVDRLNAAIQGDPALHARSIEAILRHLDTVPESIRMAVRNDGGGHANHQFFWKVIGPPGTAPSGELLAAIETDFGRFADFRKSFTDVALAHSGNGWAFLVFNPVSRKLEVLALPNNDSVLTIGKAGLLICDLWEHAYDSGYRNRRAEYLEAFWAVKSDSNGEWGSSNSRLTPSLTSFHMLRAYLNSRKWPIRDRE